jgi:hypothetical protein
MTFTPFSAAVEAEAGQLGKCGSLVWNKAVSIEL